VSERVAPMKIANRARVGSLCALMLCLVVPALHGCGGGGSLPSPSPSPVSVAVNPVSLTTGIGISRQMTASLLYSDGSSRDVTAQAAWSSSAPQVARVSGGVVTGASLGTAVITAAIGSSAGDAALAVTSDLWSAAAGMNSPRTGHTATRLNDGRVLVAGGAADGSQFQSELYDSLNDSWSLNARMTGWRNSHSATMLRDGRVLVAGGWDGTQSLASAEIYDPVANRWIGTASMSAGRYGHTATLLPDGRVLVAGGESYVRGSSHLQLASAEIFDGSTGSWSLLPNMASARSWHVAAPLPDGSVLVAGGVASMSRWPLAVADAERFDPATGGWVPVPPMAINRYAHTANALAEGRVLVAGGFSGTSLNIAASTAAEIYDPASATWSTVASMTQPRIQHSATLLPNGRVIAVGGGGGNAPYNAEIYDPASNAWMPTMNLAGVRSSHTATLTRDGALLIAGGSGMKAATLASCELYW
jgi:N-acetylneuraminic acid mutarotase